MFDSQKDKIAVIQTSDGKYFLPRRGIEKSETHEECLKRESLEEMEQSTYIISQGESK
ncbi:hypothetical protein ACQKM9_04985 [Viridibacillus sp. NPDC093762]|uniref:hypothetical protein n=1 Tax=Viridibacillus sp. NPDC093762 TaxID=3390720 RepID=UPI003D093A77